MKTTARTPALPEPVLERSAFWSCASWSVGAGAANGRRVRGEIVRFEPADGTAGEQVRQRLRRLGRRPRGSQTSFAPARRGRCSTAERFPTIADLTAVALRSCGTGFCPITAPSATA